MAQEGPNVASSRSILDGRDSWRLERREDNPLNDRQTVAPETKEHFGEA